PAPRDHGRAGRARRPRRLHAPAAGDPRAHARGGRGRGRHHAAARGPGAPGGHRREPARRRHAGRAPVQPGEPRRAQPRRGVLPRRPALSYEPDTEEKLSMRIGVLRGRENSFPDAFIARVNAMDKGVTAEFIQLGGTKLNEPVPYRVVLDRMSHEVPYYAVYLKMAALQGTYCINNTFWRICDDKFFGYAAAE